MVPRGLMVRLDGSARPDGGAGRHHEAQRPGWTALVGPTEGLNGPTRLERFFCGTAAATDSDTTTAVTIVLSLSLKS